MSSMLAERATGSCQGFGDGPNTVARNLLIDCTAITCIWIAKIHCIGGGPKCMDRRQRSMLTVFFPTAQVSEDVAKTPIIEIAA